SGRLETLEHWFASFSADELDAQLLCLQARVLMKRGRFEQAQLLVQLAENRMQPGSEVSVLLLQAQLTWVNGRYQEALQKAQHLLELTDAPVLRAQALRLLGICYNRLGQPRLAIDQFKLALTIEQERGDLYEIAQIQRDIGLCYRAIGHLHLAENYYSQADAYWASLGDLGLRAMSLNSKASVQHLAGRYGEALDTFTQALQYAREAAQPSKEAVVLSCIGDLYADLRLFDRARAMYDDARKLTATAHTSSDLHIASIRLLCAYGQFDEASQAIQTLPATTHQSHAQIIRLLHVTIAIGLGRYEKARQLIDELIHTLSESDPSMTLARAYVMRAEIIARTQPHQPAPIMDAFEQAATVADQLGHDSFLVVDTQHLQPILRQTLAQNWKRAANWLKRQDELAALRQSLLQVQERPSLIVRTLGVEHIVFQGEVIEFNWQKTREVFYYLLSHPEGVLLETLREMLWPDLPAKQRSERLRTAIYQLRTELSRELVESQGRQIYRLKRDLVHLDYDVEQFLETVNHCDSSLEALIEAVDRYSGPYLPSNDAQWCLNLRSHLEQRYLYALLLIADKYLERKAYQDALVMYQRILEIDNLNEHVHGQIMVCQMGLGNRSAAINQYHHMRRVLDEELGLDPDDSSAAEHLYRQLIAAVPPGKS
ncbi:MAG TPA: BTAD domain-containing putative transcriptional regulator, partial [Roseiflexaceae bacterium]|nr:BTAD domain-containing putative transcriptional regulator [Roseiflexaceae bacterium]